MAGFRNVSFDDRDTNTLRYQGFWFQQGTWNASNIGQTGTLSSSNDLNASVTFDFPQPAVAFYYYGIPRSGGGTYGICVDCDPNGRNFETIDAVNSTDDGKNPPVLLFSRQFPTPAVHEIILRNEPDPRFTNNNSQITIDRFEIEVVDPNAPPPSTSLASTPTPTPTTTQMTPTSFITTTAQATPQGSSKTPVGAIVGGVLGGLALLLMILAFWLWCWKKKKQGLKESDTPERLAFDPPPTTLQSQSTLGGMSEVQTSTSRPVYTRNKMTGKRRNDHRPGPSLGSSTEWTSTAASSGRVIRREVDAGPVGGSDDVETLPPDYEQAVGSSRTRSSSRLHAVSEGGSRVVRAKISKH